VFCGFPPFLWLYSLRRHRLFLLMLPSLPVLLELGLSPDWCRSIRVFVIFVASVVFQTSCANGPSLSRMVPFFFLVFPPPRMVDFLPSRPLFFSSLWTFFHFWSMSRPVTSRFAGRCFKNLFPDFATKHPLVCCCGFLFRIPPLFTLFKLLSSFAISEMVGKIEFCFVLRFSDSLTPKLVSFPNCNRGIHAQTPPILVYLTPPLSASLSLISYPPNRRNPVSPLPTP